MIRNLHLMAVCLGVSLLTFIHANAANEQPGTKSELQNAEPFRPEPGKFPALEKALT